MERKAATTTLVWQRHPFYGGCLYLEPNFSLHVIGYYSSEVPVEFERDCRSWKTSMDHTETFDTAQAAMDACKVRMNQLFAHMHFE